MKHKRNDHGRINGTFGGMLQDAGYVFVFVVIEEGQGNL